ncbi:MAG: DUF1127 domain-containing protein [Tabrizicola sp.]
MWKLIKRWWDAEGAMVGLQGMSDRMLEDMGLERESLRARVQGEVSLSPSSCACLPAGRLVRS